VLDRFRSVVTKGDMTTTDRPLRLRDRDLTFANGVAGRTLVVPSASPVNYHQAISRPQEMPAVIVDGKLFLPPGADPRAPSPAIIVVPGSLGVAESHLRHAQTFIENGIAAFVLDSFGARNVVSTVANQTLFSFAASAYDVLAAWKVLAALPEIDPSRIGAQGHSRGGSAVLVAAVRRFADAIVGGGNGLRGVLAAYPWCGHQFLEPGVGSTRVHVVMGDADEWCSPMQAQAHCHAIRAAGGQATMRLVGKAQHSFDRGTAVVEIPDARISPNAPIAFIADDGALVHPLEDAPRPELVDRDVMVYALKAGYGRIGARIGSAAGEAELFTEEMLRFWQGALS
jgi:dienelactone hydrolase